MCCIYNDFKDISIYQMDGFRFIYGRCEYLDTNDECSIYENRPLVCQVFTKGSKGCLRKLQQEYIPFNKKYFSTDGNLDIKDI